MGAPVRKPTKQRRKKVAPSVLVRAWAAQNGYNVSKYGAIPARAWEAYAVARA